MKVKIYEAERNGWLVINGTQLSDDVAPEMTGGTIFDSVRDDAIIRHCESLGDDYKVVPLPEDQIMSSLGLPTLF